MRAGALTGAGHEASVAGRPRAPDTILYGGLVVGVLDGLCALITARAKDSGVRPSPDGLASIAQPPTTFFLGRNFSLAREDGQAAALPRGGVCRVVRRGGAAHRPEAGEA